MIKQTRVHLSLGPMQESKGLISEASFVCQSGTSGRSQTYLAMVKDTIVRFKKTLDPPALLRY